MARKNWIILVVLLALAGLAGIGWQGYFHYSLHQRVEAAQNALVGAPSAEQFLALYEQWSCLPEEQKIQTPWGTEPYGGPELQRQMKAYQPQRFLADLPGLLSGVISYPPQLAEMLYGSAWQEQIASWQKKQERASLLAMLGGVCLSAAGVLGLGMLVRWLIGIFSSGQGESAQTCSNEPIQQDTPVDLSAERPPVRPLFLQQTNFMKPLFEAQSGAPRFEGHNRGDSLIPPLPSSMSSHGMPAMPKTPPISQPAQAGKPPAVSDSQNSSFDLFFGWALDAKSNEVTKSAPSLMTPEPVVKGLTELSEEVSAIRQLAAAQQDQMRKLQDGYDWMLVRRFCMRIIRCIDNIEDRLAKLGERSSELAKTLTDIHDELLFALESSGVEPFTPDLKIPYKGLERYVEALSQRVATSDPALDGAIAEVVRAGYQYLISEEEVKIVRCAQVKLYAYSAAEQRS